MRRRESSSYSLRPVVACVSREPVLLVLGLLFVILPGCGSEDSAPHSPARALPEQTAYDVHSYDLRVEVFPERKALAGRVVVQATAQDSLRHFVLNLDRRLTVDSAWTRNGTRLPVDRREEENQLWMRLPEPKGPGETLGIRVAYRGSPRPAPDPPWEGGITWARTSDGRPWVATSCQLGGADLWWPAKDFLGDEPDSMNIEVTVPRPLMGTSNGRLESVEGKAGERRTFHWKVHAPINPYGVAIAVAPYRAVRTSYESNSGRTLPLVLFALPSHETAARQALSGYRRQLRFLENTLGPFPFQEDKIGVAETPFAGMEHQTLVAHNGPLGQRGGLGYNAPFDVLMLHEVAHEWMGNSVTAAGWKDLWLHEGFATYLEALYMEEIRGDTAYVRVVERFRREAESAEPAGPIAWREPVEARRAYRRALYYRGALTLHALRRRIGEQSFLELLRRFAQPTRRASTADFIQEAEGIAGHDLTPFFERWLFAESLPPQSPSSVE